MRTELNPIQSISISSCFVLLSSCFSGCADSVWWGGESNLGATETGVVAGAAIGAGLGAFIGSTAGSTGEGLVVGALAGGVTGGLVGREIELEEGVKSERAESYRQKEDMFQQQRKEQNQIRRRTSDSARNTTEQDISPKHSSYSRDRAAQRGQLSRSTNYERSITSTASNGGERVRYGNKTYLNPPSRPNAELLAYSSRDYVGRQNLKKEREISAASARPATTDRVIFQGKARPVDSLAALPKSSTPPPALQEKPEPEHAHAPAIETSGALPVAQPIDSLPPVSKSEPAAEKNSELASLQEAPAVDQCVDAQEEAARAGTATSDADKLFYLTRAIRLCPQNSSYHTQVGKVYAKIGRQQDAEFEFRQALDLDEHNEEAAKLLGKKNAAGQKDNHVSTETAAIDSEDQTVLPEAEY